MSQVLINGIAATQIGGGWTLAEVPPTPLAAFAGHINKSWYSITNKSPAEAEVMIYDEIGAWGITAKQFVSDLKTIKADTIHLRLNTPGGEVFDATAIYNALKEHKAKVIAHIDGLAASAGSVIAMSGDEIRMADNAYMMIHKARAGVGGTADDMRRCADMMDKVNNNIADTYQAKAGKTRDHWLNLMDAETWFTAEEARAEGLADAVDATDSENAKATNKTNFDFKIYNKIPDPVRRMWDIPKPISTPTAALDSATPPAVPNQEITAMAENTPNAPTAQTPAAATPGIPQGDELAKLKNQTAEGYYDHGRKAGFVEGEQAATNRFKAIMDVCPGSEKLAISAFLSGQQPAAVKLAFESAQAEKAAGQKQIDELVLKNARLEQLMATGGTNPVSMGIGDVGDEPTGLDPKIQAEQEWDRQPKVRNGFSKKENYVNFRVAQLKGQFRSHTAPSERA